MQWLFVASGFWPSWRVSLRELGDWSFWAGGSGLPGDKQKDQSRADGSSILMFGFVIA